MTVTRIEGGRVFAASRLRISQGLMILVAGSSLVACHKDPPPAKPKPAVVVVKKSPAEIKQLADAATESLEGLKPLLAALNTKFTSLHQQYDTLPTDLPEFGETRAKFYAADEGVGRMNAKIPWLSGRIDDAVKAGDGAELEEVSKSIAATYTEDVPQANRAALELLHAVAPFTHMAETYDANKKAMCDTASAAISKKSQ